MKKEKILLLFIISFIVLVLTIILVIATNSSQNPNQDKLLLRKCMNNAIFERNNCLKEATSSYHNCSSGTNINYYEKGMDFWKYLRQCQEKLRPLQKTCKDNYDIGVMKCKNPSNNSTNPVCGNGICETGESYFCPPCVYSNPACMIACTVGSCPQDCPYA